MEKRSPGVLRERRVKDLKLILAQLMRSLGRPSASNELQTLLSVLEGGGNMYNGEEQNLPPPTMGLKVDATMSLMAR